MKNNYSIKILTFLILLTFPHVSFSFNASHVQKLKSLNQCKGCDLSNADLERANLIGANLRGADLTGSDLTG